MENKFNSFWIDNVAQKVIASPIYYGIGINLENQCKWLSTGILSTRNDRIFFFFFFLSGYFFTDTNDSQYSRWRFGSMLYSTRPLRPSHEHSDIYLQLYMWDDYHVFLIAPLVSTSLLLDGFTTLLNYHFWIPFLCLLTCLCGSRFLLK